MALIEDDQLVEVYFQRANEYSLAGSIHKGRVTRVLPGMQSAFVDLGLDRDTFLYVSDFLEEHEDVDMVTGEGNGCRGTNADAAPDRDRQESRPSAPAPDSARAAAGDRVAGSRAGSRGRGRAAVWSSALWHAAFLWCSNAPAAGGRAYGGSSRPQVSAPAAATAAGDFPIQNTPRMFLPVREVRASPAHETLPGMSRRARLPLRWNRTACRAGGAQHRLRRERPADSTR